MSKKNTHKTPPKWKFGHRIDSGWSLADRRALREELKIFGYTDDIDL